jgi:hypothetical protein
VLAGDAVCAMTMDGRPNDKSRKRVELTRPAV